MVVYNTSGNTFSTAVTGGTTPADNLIRHIEDYVAHLEPEDCPLTTMLGFGKSINQRKPEWGQKQRVQRTSTLNGALTNSATTLNVPVGHGVRFSQYDVWELISWKDGNANTGILDYSTREQVWVEASPAADAVTIVRGHGQTTGVAHLDGAFLEKIGSAMTQNSDFALTPVRRGSMTYNRFQRFQQKASADKAARKMPTYEEKGDLLVSDIREKTYLLKEELEKTCWRGSLSDGSATVPEGMAGIDEFIDTNRIDLAGEMLNRRTFEDLVSDLWADFGSRPGKSLWMDMTTARIVDTFIPSAQRQATMKDGEIKNMVNTLTFRTGNYTIKHNRHVPPGKIYLLNEKALSLHPFEGHGWQTFKHTTDGPYDETSIWGEYTMIFKEEPTHAVIENFNTDLDFYPTDF